MSPEMLFALAIVGVAVPALVAIANTLLTISGNKQAAQLHQQINSRMDEMIALVRSQAHAAGREEAQAEAQVEAKKVLAATKEDAATVRAEARQDRVEGAAAAIAGPAPVPVTVVNPEPVPVVVAEPSKD